MLGHKLRQSPVAWASHPSEHTIHHLRANRIKKDSILIPMTLIPLTYSTFLFTFLAAFA